MPTARSRLPLYLIPLTGAAAIGLLILGAATGNSSAWVPGIALAVVAGILVCVRARR